MINQNSKTQIQARIDAATGATSLNDLLLLRKAAENLCCNESNLDTLINAAVNAQNGLTPLAQVFAGRAAFGLRGNVMYQTPVAVKAGDELFIDALGKVKTEQYPMRGAAALTNVSSSAGIAGNANATVKGYVVGGGLQSSAYGGASAVLTLSDGNLLYLTAEKSDATSQLIHGAIVAPDETTILSTHELAALVNGADYSNSSKLIGVFEISANVFRVYYTTGAGGSTAAHVIRYVTLTYNTGTKSLSSAAGATVATSSNTSGNYQAYAPQKQGDRYILVGAPGSGTQWCLDMQASTVIAYTGVTAMERCTEFDNSIPGSEYAYALQNGTPKLARAGVDSALSLPANLTSDGCFGSTWMVQLIGSRMFASFKAGNPVKLVKFSNDWLTATIYTMSTVAPTAITAASDSRALILKSIGNRFFVKTHPSESMFSFVWDGLAAPYGIDRTAGWLSTTPVVVYFRNRLPVLQSGDRVTYSMIAGQFIAYASMNYQSNMINFFTFDAAEMIGLTPAKVGMTLNDAAANGLVELQLGADTVTDSNITTPLRSELVIRNGLRSEMSRDRQASMDTATSLTSSAMTTVNYASAARELTVSQGQGIAGSLRSFASGGALITSPKVGTSVYAQGKTPAGEDSAANLAVMSVEACANPSNSVTSVSGLIAKVIALIKTDKPVYIGFGGRTGAVLWEREL